jgi:hypothetical protein
MAEQMEQAKHPGGRPRLTFDLRLVEDLGKIQSTHAELAAVLDCHLETVRDRLKNDPEFSAAYEKGLENGKSSLRRIQWKAALSGNTTMQIWLGKQYLCQRDSRQEIEYRDQTEAIHEVEELRALIGVLASPPNAVRALPLLPQAQPMPTGRGA